MNAPLEILKKWTQFVVTGQVENVLALYNEAVLVPTFSDVIRNTPSTIEDYFAGLSVYRSVAIDWLSGENRQKKENVVVISGFYDWSFVPKSEDQQPFVKKARYTYVIDSNSDTILHHHSSEVPQ